MTDKLGISLRWMAVTCFEMRFDGITVVSDPYVTDCKDTDLSGQDIENCDIICLSHAHFDHITDIPYLTEKYRPLILCGDQTALPIVQWLDYTPTRVYPMYPDTELDFGPVKIRALYGRHTEQNMPLKRQLEFLNSFEECADEGVKALQTIGSFEYRNYLFTLKNGVKILLWGNDPTPEQVNICRELRPDVAIIQRSCDITDIRQKAEFAAAIGCKTVIPHHHDFPTPVSFESLELLGREFLRLVPDGRYIIPAHGQWIDL